MLSVHTELSKVDKKEDELLVDLPTKRKQEYTTTQTYVSEKEKVVVGKHLLHDYSNTNTL